uniref:Immunoglobulin C2-set-like ligand-binding domain-containing protein n=1 Tax=Chelonoidis abingdonii TaxID=106734 RepID=A0A8C0GS89_CHEAB
NIGVYSVTNSSSDLFLKNDSGGESPSHDLNAYISPESPEIERGSTLKLLCILENYDMPYGNASHVIWKLNQNLIAQENYNIINETVAGLIPCLCIILSLALWFDFVI